MSNKVIIAAAGSGKTTHLINEALRLRDAVVLITTFTDENEKEIRNRFIQECNCIPSNIVIKNVVFVFTSTWSQTVSRIPV